MTQTIMREPGIAMMKATYLRLAELSDWEKPLPEGIQSPEDVQRERNACAYELASAIAPLLHRVITAEWMGDQLYRAALAIEQVAPDFHAHLHPRLGEALRMWEGEATGMGREITNLTER